MPRPIDPELRLARRLQIIDAGLTAFAQHGYAGATTAKICAIAGISSGTFFHHFPTKESLLIAILELGEAETRDFFATADPAAPRQIVSDYLRHVIADLTDPRAATFIATVGGLATKPAVAEALLAEQRCVRDGLRSAVAAAQNHGQVRTDLSADRLGVWIALLVDGFAAQVAGGGFDAVAEAPLLTEQVAMLLDGPT